MEGNLRPAMEAMRLLENNIKSIQDAMRLFEKNIKPIQDTMRLVEIDKQWKDIVKPWDEVNRICFELGWFPYGQWGPDAGRTILELYKEKKYDQLDDEICNFYSNEIIGNLVEAWQFKKAISHSRLNILKQAINAHLSQNYSIATIAFLSQVEGCIRDVLKNYNKVNHRKLVRKFRENIINSTLNNSHILRIEQVFDLIINKIFCQHGHDKKTGEIKFSRHSVLHGFCVNNLDRNKSCKLILLLNFIIMNEIFVRDIERRV